MTCVHHFIIDEPNGPTSKGKCKKCGLESEFPNSVDYQDWCTWRDLPDKEEARTDAAFAEIIALGE